MKKTFILLCEVLMMTVGSLNLFAFGKKKSQNISNKNISVISREDGSGTRGAFIELFGIEKKNEQGKKIDYTTDEADITNSTEVMMTSVAGNIAAIGYISLGSYNKKVKALKIDGEEATVGNIKKGNYKIARPFNIVTDQNELTNVTADFVRFILSANGQSIVEKNGYISSVNNPSYIKTNKTGKITIAGSSSVTPVMEKLTEAYKELNPSVEIEIQMSDSTTGINSMINGICDLGIASRSLKESEIAKGVKQTTIAIDGIVVIVNNNNPINTMSSEVVKEIFTGEITKWGKIN